MQATGRLRKNAHYFKVNYLIVMLGVTLITLALNPTSLIALAFLAMAWVYLFVVRQAPIVIAGRTFRRGACPNLPHACMHACLLASSQIRWCRVVCSEREKFIGISIVSGIVIFFLTRCSKDALPCSPGRPVESLLGTSCLHAADLPPLFAKRKGLNCLLCALALTSPRPPLGDVVLGAHP